MPTTLRLITETEFRTSRYAQLADQLEGNLTDVIARAEAHVERHVDRTLAKTSFTEYLRPPGALLFVRNYPIVTLTSVEVRSTPLSDWSALDLSEFRVQRNGETGIVESLTGLILNREVKIVYEAGYATGSLPFDIREAVILQTAYFCYQDLEIYGAGDGKKPGITYLQDDVYKYLKPHRRREIY